MGRERVGELGNINGSGSKKMGSIIAATTRSRLLILTIAIGYMAVIVVMISSLFDGYLQHGTFGWVVPPVLVLMFINFRKVALPLWFHVVKADPVLFVRDGVISYLVTGQKGTRVSDIRSFEVVGRGLRRSLKLDLRNQTAGVTYPLMLSSQSDRAIKESISSILN